MTDRAKFPSLTALKLMTDTYERKARLYPALVVLAPVAVTVAALISVDTSVARSIGALVITCGGAFFLAQLARDAGKTGEGKLFVMWGGMPSVSVFRHRDQRIGSITKLRFHGILANLVDGTSVITEDSELENAARADQTYEAWSHHLRTHTRDTAKYSLIFQELINYGYRRNVWGLRPFGLVITLLCCIVSAGRCVFIYRAHHVFDSRSAAAFCVALAFIFFWTVRASPSWVRLAADAYAERLIEAADTLIKAPVPKTTMPPKAKKTKPPTS